MAQERPVTPEKQLLNLIETGSPKNPVTYAQAAKRQGMALVSPGAWLGRITFLKDKFKRWQNSGVFQFDIKLLNRTLMILVSGLALYFFTSVSISAVSLTHIPTLKFSPQEVKDQSEPLGNMSSLKNAASYYLEKIRQRDIFKIGEKAQPKESAPSAPAPKVIEEVQRLKLVGISWSNDPDAMIEDSTALRTFFVKRGQMIGRVKIEAIFKDKVVLSFEGQETELR